MNIGADEIEKAVREFSQRIDSKPQFYGRQPYIPITGTVVQFESSSSLFDTTPTETPVAAIQQEAGTTTALLPFQLSDASDATHVQASLTPSTIDGVVPSQVASGNWVFAVASYQEIYAHVTIDGTTGAITARLLGSAASTPTDTTTDFYTQIGNVQPNGTGGVTVVNYRYGPVVVTVCRNWFSNPASYGVTFS